MKLIKHPTRFPEVWVIELHCYRDERGFFMETYHRKDFETAGLTSAFVQDNHSRSVKGVLRGIHYQDMTAPMGKLVRCTYGSIWDAVVDLRLGSETFGQWYSHELTAENQLQLWCPPGFGHAFLTLSDVAEVQYKCTSYYSPSAEGSVLWNDPEIGIEWPLREVTLSGKDRIAQTLESYRKCPAFRYPVAKGPDSDMTAS